jgi:TolB protein
MLHRITKLAWAVPIAFLLAGEPGAASSSPSLIAYTQVTGRVPHIWTMNVDKGTSRQLTRGRYGEETPSWSPNGRWLVYAETRMLSALQIGPVLVVRDMARGTVRAITSGRAALDETPTWSPAGGRIAFVRTIFPSGTQTGPPEEIWTVGTNGRGARQLTHNSVSDVAPAWSPTGRWLVYARARDSSFKHWDLWKMRADGSGQRFLARNGTRPAWSPNGRQIAFGQPTGQMRGCCLVTDLVVMSSDGTHRRLLVKNGGRPAWSPDGSRIVFQRVNGGHLDLWIVNSDGSGLGRLTSASGEEYAASWRPF